MNVWYFAVSTMRFGPILHLLAVAVCLAAPAPKDIEFFESKVRPVLAKNCYSCHTQTKLGGLQVDSREALVKGGNSGPAIVPGQPEESLLLKAVRHTHQRLKMPPAGKLNDDELQSLAEWVKAGAAWPEAKVVAPKSAEFTITPEHRAFWAYQPLRKAPLPEVKDPRWARSPVDRFLAARWQSDGLIPVKRADRRTLLRRVTYDVIGLPPTPEEVDAFLQDDSPKAFAKVVDRLLASQHYGERWARHWLDLARYADGDLGASNDTPFLNAYRYRDWVIQAFNKDLPYDTFVKAQIAGDLLPENEKTMPALGFQALGENPEEILDVTSRTFLGLTVGCAQCHDHKYDPIPTKDYYSLLGVFRSSTKHQHPLAADDIVKAFKDHQQKIDDAKFELDHFLKLRANELADYMSAKTSRYMMAAYSAIAEGGDVGTLAREAKLDEQTLDRWVKYLRQPNKDHVYLKPWDDLLARKAPKEEVRQWVDGFQKFVTGIFTERAGMEERNYVKLGGVKGIRDEATRQWTNLESLEITKYYLWRDLASDPYKKDFFDFKGGVYYYGDKDIARWLSPEWKDHLEGLRERHKTLKETLPKQYPFIHAMKESDKPKNAQIAIRGDAQNLGEEAPRRFLRILAGDQPPLFEKGSGRLELAESIVRSPLAARVIVNRVWHWHFGTGIVRSTSNFGQLGERPTHVELLDYLASRLVESGWSLKALHREILLSEAYALSTEHNEQNYAKDPDNRTHWRAELTKRLEAEALRDALLSVAGSLDKTAGGPAKEMNEAFHRRAVYGYIGRTKPDPMLTLFDFPNPNNTSEQRVVTMGPLQRLFFMNNGFVAAQAKALAARLAGASPSEEDRIRQAYLLLYSRQPTAAEVQMGVDFLGKSGSWPQYAQVLLSSTEFSSIH